MPKAATAPNEASLWARVLDQTDPELSPDAAQYILGLQFPPKGIDRMNELAEKAREGTLTPRQRLELDAYERVGCALSLMKSKARTSLKKVRAAN